MEYAKTLKSMISLNDTVSKVRKHELEKGKGETLCLDTCTGIIKSYASNYTALCIDLRNGFNELDTELHYFGIEGNDDYIPAKQRYARFFERAWKAEKLDKKTGLLLKGYTFTLKAVEPTVIIPAFEQIQNLVNEVLNPDVSFLADLERIYIEMKARTIVRRKETESIVKAQKQAKAKARKADKVKTSYKELLDDMIENRITQTEFTKKVKSLQKQSNG